MWPALQNVVNKLSPSKGRKRIKRNLADELDSDEENKEENFDLQDGVEHTSFNQADKDFLLQLATVMATTTDAKLLESVDPLRKEISELKHQQYASSMLPEVDKEALKKELRDELLSEMRLGPPPGLYIQSSHGDSDAASSMDPLDITYVLGSLGTQLDQREALTTARKVLQECGREAPVDMWVPFGLGSQCYLKYPTTGVANKPRSLIKQKQLRMPGQDYNVWLDVKKSKQERMPKLLVRELEKAIIQIEQAEGQQWKIVRCTPTRRIYINKEEQVRFGLNNSLTWADGSVISETHRQELDQRIRAFAA